MTSEFRDTPDFKQCLVQADRRLNCLESQYAKSYPRLIRAVRSLDGMPVSEQLAVTAQLAYGWMPTVLKRADFTDWDLQRLQACQTIEDGLALIEAHVKGVPVNNSWIGTSKVLHFFAPHAFPIWDRRVALHFGLSSYTGVNTKPNYRKYLRYVSDVLATADLAKLSAVRHARKWNAEHAVRQVEFALFLSSPKQKSRT